MTRKDMIAQVKELLDRRLGPPEIAHRLGIQVNLVLSILDRKSLTFV